MPLRPIDAVARVQARVTLPPMRARTFSLLPVVLFAACASAPPASPVTESAAPVAPVVAPVAAPATAAAAATSAAAPAATPAATSTVTSAATPAAEAGPTATEPVAADLAATREAFVLATAARYGLSAEAIRSALDGAEIKPAIIAAMRRPAEAKPWRDYRPIFITDARIAASAKFMRTHAEALARAERQTGVPAEIITAIIGVETGFGANQGKFRVLDALYTLAFAYPRSGDPAKAERERQRELFFRDELAQLFALASEDHLDITALRGSYAGAMGWGQFMPSSWRAYAVDGDGDGRRDLFGDPDDVIASVANYFQKRGQWVRGGQVMTPAQRAADATGALPAWQDMRPLAEWARAGVRPQGVVDDADAPAGVLVLEGARGDETWLVFDNFRAITRYNTSSLYATAVYQLAQAAFDAVHAASTAATPSAMPATPTRPR